MRATGTIEHMYESSEGQVPGPPDAQAVLSSVDEAFAQLLDELFSSPRLTYAATRELPTSYHGHRLGRPRHRRFVLRAGVDLDDPR